MKRLGSQRGFTFLEVIAATVLLGMAIVLSMSATQIITTNEQNVKNFSQAHNIGVTLMEELMAHFATDANLTAGSHTRGYDMNGRPVAADPKYTAEWIVTYDTPVTKTMSIQVYIRWQDNGRDRVVHFLTYRLS